MAQYVLYLAQFGQDSISKPQGLAIPVTAANARATGLGIERDAFALCLASPDAQEGTSAFLEKRKPVFKGELNS